jgi:hypothetical protein
VEKIAANDVPSIESHRFTADNLCPIWQLSGKMTGRISFCARRVQFIAATKNSRSYGTGFLEIRRGAMTTDLRTVFIGLAMVVVVFAVAMGIHFASKV